MPILGLTEMAEDFFQDSRHRQVRMARHDGSSLRQSVSGRLGGYDDA